MVIDGPFIETKELIAGYWLWEVASLDEAIAWVRKCPHPHPGHDTEIEIRPVYGPETFTGIWPEAEERENAMREAIAGRG
jgi:hypothetical protein